MWRGLCVRLVLGMTAVALGLSMAACQKDEPAANEAVVEEPMANESHGRRTWHVSMDMNATESRTPLMQTRRRTPMLRRATPRSRLIVERIDGARPDEGAVFL